MVRYINQLSSSGSVQSSEGNYGVGAKIAAATRNHAGLLYLSWKNGRGTMIHLWRDPRTGEYGLRQVERPDGTYDHFAEIDDDVKPEIIEGHGTKVVLFGNALDEDTMKAPPGSASPSGWIAKYLNNRYFRFPAGVIIRARQGWEHPRSNTDVNVLRTLQGQEKYLNTHMQTSGTLPLTDAVAHWWILKDESALGSNSGWIESSGHIAALYKDELYEPANGRSGSAKLQQFGVIFGQRQVVIYVEPKAGIGRRLTTNTARMHLLLNGEPLPWSEWAAEFRSAMPPEIIQLMDEIASKATATDHSKSIRDRLKALLELYKVSRYRPIVSGTLQLGTPEANSGGQPINSRTGRNSDGASGEGPRGMRAGMVGGVYATFLKKNGRPGTDAKADPFPEVKWVSVSDGTRDFGDIEDKAARYLPEQNLLLINADFRTFEDMIQHWLERYRREHGDTPGLSERIRDSVHDWFQQALVETVIGVQALKGSREWSIKSIEAALSEEALTAAVMPRYHPYNSIKRELGTQIGPLKGAKV